MRSTLDTLDHNARRRARVPLLVLVIFVLLFVATSLQFSTTNRESLTQPRLEDKSSIETEPIKMDTLPEDEPQQVKDNSEPKTQTKGSQDTNQVVDKQKWCSAAILANAPAHHAKAGLMAGCHFKRSFVIDTLHAVVPEATVFADIGVNKGYHTVSIMALYRPHWGLTNTNWYSLDKSILCGACSDCRMVETPIVPMSTRICGGPNVPADGICFSPDKPLPEMRFLAFDGSPVFQKKIFDQLEKHVKGYKHPDSYPKAWATDLSKLKDNMWTVQNYAFMEKYAANKTVKFLEFDEQGQILDESFPQGAKPADAPSSPVYVEVPVMTIDEMRKQNNIKHFDLIKTDTEGFDAIVARGAISTLRDQAVTMYTMEIHGLWRNEKIIDTVRMFEENGYACFGEYEHSLVKYSHGCWSDIYQAAIRWGNMACVLSTTARGQKIIESFDAHSAQFMA